MLSSVLRSKRAIAVNIEIMRAFVELRRIASSYALIEKRLEQIERGMGEHDEQLEQIFNALRQLMAPPPQPVRPIAGSPLYRRASVVIWGWSHGTSQRPSRAKLCCRMPEDE
jgi:hypothetical protein